ncbi:MAG: U32 family peptidase [Victivallaceae bacterium]|nr:U32 family peptidase [Victivallaceae bacterium]
MNGRKTTARNAGAGKIELLAPAGGIGTALAAFDAGADAVYVGLSKFNARERTENFGFDQLSQLLAYAHKNGRKVHVALNTLIKESELPELAEYLSELNFLRPDAVIVQDLGVVRMIREFFPALTVHASTQMGIHNSAGVGFAERLGVTRVILERQTTLEEIAAIRGKTGLELEIFAHGALCCGLSGGCLFSSFLGGASGNRGKCKQPCRRYYAGGDAAGYLFSPADLNTLALVPEFKKLGIDSLKIEGRMKKADYVQNAVAAYRMVIDAEHATPELMAEASAILERTAGRRASTGFLYKRDFARLIDPAQPGVWGYRIGTVEKVLRDGIAVRLTRRIHQGDRLRLLTDFEEDGPGMTAAGLTVNGRPVPAARPGELCFVRTDAGGAAKKGAPVCKIGECCRDLSARAAALPKQKILLNLAITLSATELEVAGNGIDWKFPLNLEAAEKCGVTPAELEKLFSESGSERFGLSSAKITVNGSLFFPASIRKEARRAFYSSIEENPPPDAAADGGQLYRFFKQYSAMTASNAAPPSDTVIGNAPEPGVNCVELAAYRPGMAVDELLLPQFCPEARLPELERAVRAAVSAGIVRFRAAGLYALELLNRIPGLAVTAAAPLPAMNSQAVELLCANGVTQIELWPELERSEAEKLQAKSCLPLQQHLSGAVELLQTRATVKTSGSVRDRRGNEFTVSERGGITRITTVCQVKPQNRLPGTGRVEDRRYPADENTDGFNWTRELL